MADRLNLTLPFDGFYGSLWADGLESEARNHASWLSGDNGDEPDDGELAQPEPLRLSYDDLDGLLSDATDWSAAHLAVAQDYVKAFEDYAEEVLGVSLGLTFEALTSPRFYNFETDRIFADADAGALARLLAQSEAEGHATLARVIRDRFTARDGFLPHYSADIADWLAKPLTDWDHNELGTLLMAALAAAGAEDIRWPLYERVADGEGFYHAWSDAVDWKGFERAREDARDDKLDDLRDEDPDVWAALTGDDPAQTVVRCPLTADLFDHQAGA